MLRRLKWATATPEVKGQALTRPQEGEKARVVAAEIVDRIAREGDSAVFDLAKTLDGWDKVNFLVPEVEITNAINSLDGKDREAILGAIQAVERFHRDQGYRSYRAQTWPGVQAERRVLPIERVALYIPAGSAPLVSTLIMLGVPAKLAEVDEIICLVPPGPDGKVNSTILATAGLLGLTQVYAIGGAHGVAAAGLGKGGLPKVDKIYGPGNAYVAAAKAILAQMPGGAAADLPAGPSEVLVIADGQANPKFVAADLLSQAEHDPIAQVILLSDSERLLSEVDTEIAGLIETLERKYIATQSLPHARSILVRDLDEAFDVSNAYAPEHLILQIADASVWIDKVRHAGSVFVGPWTPEAAGDYAAGPNHALPTAGAARAYGGVTVEMFQKTMTVLTMDATGARNLGPTVERLADLEGLGAHALAMRLRREAAAVGEGAS